MGEQAGVLIVGSLNMDLVVGVERLPQRGETIAGREFVMLPGGKGANQAYAVGRLLSAARAGAGPAAQMIGCVGRDIYGDQLRASLQAVGVDVAPLRVVEGASGVALITVEAGGQNQIVVVGGANDCLTAEDARAGVTAARASYLLLQLESPLAAVEAAAIAGRARGMTVVLDPAPARRLPASLLHNIDLLTPNESEALALLGAPGDAISLADAPELARRLLRLGPRCVVLKLGAQGVWLADGARGQHFPARAVTAVDATAAGDCFNGALAVGLAEGRSLDQAIDFAIAAAALSVTRRGAQASIPSRAEVDALLRGGDDAQPLPRATP